MHNNEQGVHTRLRGKADSRQYSQRHQQESSSGSVGYNPQVLSALLVLEPLGTFKVLLNNAILIPSFRRGGQGYPGWYDPNGGLFVAPDRSVLCRADVFQKPVFRRNLGMNTACHLTLFHVI